MNAFYQGTKPTTQEVVLQERPDFSYCPFSSWIDGQAPSGYFSADDARLPDFFREYGFLVLQDGLSPEEINQLNQDATDICRGHYGLIQGLEAASANQTDDEVLRRYLCIHFPHKLSPVALAALSQPSVVDVLTQVGLR